ncbi:MAG TPA: hypothetical protein VK550_26235 [Polyangiaceae bacterium]|nr:hypothetical protein [Polyangiaceae bacterium]
MFSPRFWLILLLSSVVANVAFAARTKSNGLVLIAEGTDRDTQREISDAIARDMRGQSSEELLAALADEGVTGSVGEALQNPRTRKPTIVAIQKSIRAVGAAAVLSVRAKRNKAGAREMHVVLIVPTQAAPMIEEDFTLSPGEKATAQVGPLLSASLPDLVRSSSATAAASPPAASPPPAAPPASDAEVDGDRPTKKAAKRPAKKKERVEEEASAASNEPADPPNRDHGATGKRTVDFTNATVIGEAAVGVGRRQLQYSDPWIGRLRPYIAPGIAVYSVAAELYPGASTNIEVLKDIGLVGRFAGSLAVESETTDGQKVKGSFQRYAFGLRARIPTGDRKSRPLIGVEATYGLWNYAFTGTDEAVDESPSVRYTNFRIGGDARIPFGPWALVAGAGYMNIGSAGTLSERFPKLTVAGVDALGGGSWVVAWPIELRLLVTYTRFFSSANPDPGADYVAGGTLDQYVILTLGASTIF